jgi:hypothetical protein
MTYDTPELSTFDLRLSTYDLRHSRTFDFILKTFDFKTFDYLKWGTEWEIEIKIYI